MANQSHLALLKEGASTWNAWRREHSEKWSTILVWAVGHEKTLVDEYSTSVL